MQRVVTRKLPNGDVRLTHPFHVSLKGLEQAVLFRDDDDYDAAVKILCVCAKRNNVIVIIYSVVSNHCHAGVLAANYADAYEFAIEVKRMISMHFSFRHGKSGIMQQVDVQAIPLTDDWHVRNALAYIPRNAMDNGGNVTEYEWTGFRGMFSKDEPTGRRVAFLTTRESEQIMHTGDNLTDTDWLLDEDGHLIARSWCDHEYLEQAFENDPSFFYRLIGSVSPAQMNEILIENPRKRVNDSEFVKIVNETCLKWYKTDIKDITTDKKLRIASLLYRTTRTSVPQLSRALEVPRDKIATAINHKTTAGNV